MSLIPQPFAKINLNTSFTRLSRKGEFTQAYGPISYYHVKGQPFPFKWLKAWKPDLVRWVEIVGDDIAGPHVDHGIVTSLNCYMDTNGEITQYWTPNEGTMAYRYAGAATNNIYRSRDLSPTGSFKAERGDAYLLDVSSIHSVERADLLATRRFIQLSWQHRPFSDVLAAINATLT